MCTIRQLRVQNRFEPVRSMQIGNLLRLGWRTSVLDSKQASSYCRCCCYYCCCCFRWWVVLNSALCTGSLVFPITKARVWSYKIWDFNKVHHHHQVKGSFPVGCCRVTSLSCTKSISGGIFTTSPTCIMALGSARIPVPTNPFMRFVKVCRFLVRDET